MKNRQHIRCRRACIRKRDKENVYFKHFKLFHLQERKELLSLLIRTTLWTGVLVFLIKVSSHIVYSTIEPTLLLLRSCSMCVCVCVCVCEIDTNVQDIFSFREPNNLPPFPSWFTELNEVDQKFLALKNKIECFWCNILYHPSAMICGSFYWHFSGMKTVIGQKVRATILGHVFNSSSPSSSLRITPRAFCPMVSLLGSFEPVVYLFLFYHKKEDRKLRM